MKRRIKPTLLTRNERSLRAASLFAILTTAACTAHAADATVAEDVGPLQEITVTATRHEENLSKVPISVTALTQDAMDLRGIKDIQDVARFTPGVVVDNSGTNNISIRGISSSGGAGTTGIYIDDTPIQIRALAFNPDDALPKAFDVDRIEVLRGPQGTLFGAGSEGGTVRYITTQPSLTKTSFYSRDEVSYTQGGSPSYEVGLAAGGPLIDGTLGAAPRFGTGTTAATSIASIHDPGIGREECELRPHGIDPTCSPMANRWKGSILRRAFTTKIATATTWKIIGRCIPIPAATISSAPTRPVIPIRPILPGLDQGRRRSRLRQVDLEHFFLSSPRNHGLRRHAL